MMTLVGISLITGTEFRRRWRIRGKYSGDRAQKIEENSCNQSREKRMHTVNGAFELAAF